MRARDGGHAISVPQMRRGRTGSDQGNRLNSSERTSGNPLYRCDRQAEGLAGRRSGGTSKEGDGLGETRDGRSCRAGGGGWCARWLRARTRDRRRVHGCSSAQRRWQFVGGTGTGRAGHSHDQHHGARRDSQRRNRPGTASVSFTATVPGVFEVELEQSKLQLLQLQVS
jgi:hypothetical protein